MFLEIVFTGLVLYCIHAYFTKSFGYFKHQGISGPKPVPIFGNYFGVWRMQYHQQFVENQKRYGKIYGTFDGRKPNLVVADPDMLKGILVKNFDCFTNRPDIVVNNRYLELAVGGLRDQQWKDARGTMSVAFTSGKMRKLFSQMEDCALGMVKHMNSLLEQSTKPSVELDAKEITTGYALDVISSCGLGMKIPSIRDPNDPFVQKGMRILQGDNGTPFKNFCFTLVTLYPKLGKLIPASAFAELDFFIEVGKQIIQGKKSQKDSEENVDLLELLIQSAKDASSPFRNEDMIFAQVLVFLLAGFDTAATALASTLHCLAMNQEIQQKLRDSVRNAIKANGGITYDCVQNIPYLDQCIFEALRLYPTNVKTERECGKTVTINNIKIEKGVTVTVPSYAIHRDPEIYPNPEIYNPERFSTEEKSKRESILHLPFGQGPRSCLGQRFAMEELRLGLAHLITNFKFDISPRTQDPIEFLDGIFILSALVAKGVWITIQKC